MHHFKVVSILFLTVFASGCAHTGQFTRTGGGWIASFKEGITATDHGEVTKRGEACSQNILGVAVGDSSIEAAMKNGRITKVSTVDSEITNVLYIYGKNCTIVHGS